MKHIVVYWEMVHWIQDGGKTLTSGNMRKLTLTFINMQYTSLHLVKLGIYWHATRQLFSRKMLIISINFWMYLIQLTKVSNAMWPKPMWKEVISYNLYVKSSNSHWKDSFKLNFVLLTQILVFISLATWLKDNNWLTWLVITYYHWSLQSKIRNRDNYALGSSFVDNELNVFISYIIDSNDIVNTLMTSNKNIVW